MIEIIDVKASHVVAIRVSGKIDKGEMQQIFTAMQAVVEQHGRINLLVELDRWQGITASGLWEDLKGGLPLAKKMQREAVVTESKFLEIWTRIGSSLWPGVEAKVFKPSEREQALAWVSE